MFDYCIATSEDFYEIKHFLKKQKTYSANRDDLIYCIRHNQNLIGLARLLTLKGSTESLWLRGLFIAPEWRKQALATNLLSHIRKSLKNTQNIKAIFAFAEPQLENFYKKNHYVVIEPEQLPLTLQHRYGLAKQQRKNWLCLQLEL